MAFSARTKFLAACQDDKLFNDEEGARSYLDELYNSLVCFYKGLNGLGSPRKIEKQLVKTQKGNYVFRIMAEKVDIRGHVSMVFLAVFSVDEVTDGPPTGVRDKYTVDAVDN